MNIENKNIIIKNYNEKIDNDIKLELESIFQIQLDNIIYNKNYSDNWPLHWTRFYSDTDSRQIDISNLYFDLIESYETFEKLNKIISLLTKREMIVYRINLCYIENDVYSINIYSRIKTRMDK